MDATLWNLMEESQHYLEFRGTMPRVHVRAHHQSAATRFRAKVGKSRKTESRKIEGKKLKSVCVLFHRLYLLENSIQIYCLLIVYFQDVDLKVC